MRLRTNEVCPIHQSLSCCGRELLPKPKLVRLGVQRVEDPHHPRGYRELRSPAEMRKLLNRKIRQQGGICAICHEAFTDYNHIVPYADIGIRNGMPTLEICRQPRTQALTRRPHGRTISAYSECLKEGKERVGWSVTTGTGIHGRSPSECLFFKSEVRMKIDLRGFHLLMTQP
jgi:hypothetical protein